MKKKWVLHHCDLDLWPKVTNFNRNRASVISNHSAKTTSKSLHPAGILFTRNTDTQTDTQTYTHTDKLKWKYNPSTISWRCNNFMMLAITTNKRFITTMTWLKEIPFDFVNLLPHPLTHDKSWLDGLAYPGQTRTLDVASVLAGSSQQLGGSWTVALRFYAILLFLRKVACQLAKIKRYREQRQINVTNEINGNLKMIINR